MKRLFLGLIIAAALISCKKETKEEIKTTTTDVETDMRQEVDTAMTKTDNAMDTIKSKMDTAMVRSAEKAEQTAKDIKESTRKK